MQKHTQSGSQTKCKTGELIEKNIQENLWDLGLGKEFLDLTPKA